MRPKVSYMNKKVMYPISLSRRTGVMLEERSAQLGLSKHRVVEELILKWITDVKSL
jgi:hypothetical protein